jgi:hypothetical protein
MAAAAALAAMPFKSDPEEAAVEVFGTLSVVVAVIFTLDRNAEFIGTT